MRAVLQRVTSARVTVDGETIGAIERGLVVLLGVAREDDASDIDYLARKIVGLRVFDDEEGKMNLALDEVGGQLLVISQFTLLGDTRKGRRPSFIDAAPPAEGDARYREFLEAVRRLGVEPATGRFQTHMQVQLVNDGPVTLVLDSRDRQRGSRS